MTCPFCWKPDSNYSKHFEGWLSTALIYTSHQPIHSRCTFNYLRTLWNSSWNLGRRRLTLYSDRVRCFAWLNLSLNLPAQHRATIFIFNFKLRLSLSLLKKRKKRRKDQIRRGNVRGAVRLKISWRILITGLVRFCGCFPRGRKALTAHLELRWIDKSPGTINQSMSLSVLAGWDSSHCKRPFLVGICWANGLLT